MTAFLTYTNQAVQTWVGLELSEIFQKHPRAHKNKIGTPPQKPKNTPPPLK